MKKIYLLFTLALLPLLAQTQKLGGMKDALRSGTSGGSSNEGRGLANGNGDVWFQLFFQLAWEPTWWLFYGGPGELRPNQVDFNQYPYADGENGLYLPYEWTTGKRMSLQLTGHLQSDEDAVYGGYFQARFSPNRAISLDVNRLQLLETPDDASSGSSAVDQFSITNLNAAYNRVHNGKFQLWWGAGLMLLNGGGNDVLYGSPSFNGGFTWYFKRPLSLYADTQLGYPNNVFARQNQLRMQVHLKQFMVYAGFQGTRVGDVRLPSVAAGSGVWF